MKKKIDKYMEPGQAQSVLLLTKFCAFILSIAMILALLVTAIDFACFDRAFYQLSYRNLQTADQIAISQEDLDGSTEVLLDYLQDKRADLQIDVTLKAVDGKAKKVAMFNEREILHMQDVKTLYQKALLARNIALLTAIFMIGILVFLYWLKHVSLMRLYIRRAYLWALLVFSLLLIAIGLAAAIHFEAFWSYFHQLLFNNELWVLDPAQDRLIMMVPSAFFSALIQRILLYAAGGLLTLTLAFCLFGIQRKKKNDV